MGENYIKSIGIGKFTIKDKLKETSMEGKERERKREEGVTVNEGELTYFSLPPRIRGRE